MKSIAILSGFVAMVSAIPASYPAPRIHPGGSHEGGSSVDGAAYSFKYHPHSTDVAAATDGSFSIPQPTGAPYLAARQARGSGASYANPIASGSALPIFTSSANAARPTHSFGGAAPSFPTMTSDGAYPSGVAAPTGGFGGAHSGYPSHAFGSKSETGAKPTGRKHQGWHHGHSKDSGSGEASASATDSPGGASGSYSAADALPTPTDARAASSEMLPTATDAAAASADTAAAATDTAAASTDVLSASAGAAPTSTGALPAYTGY